MTMTLEDVRSKAKEKLRGICGVYKICDGASNKLCQNQSYGGAIGIGGVGSGASFHNNISALQKIHLKMKLMGSHFTPNTSSTLFGQEISMPVMGAPATGVNSFGGEKVISEHDFCCATVLGCKEAGTFSFRGDAYTYNLDWTPGLDAIKDAGGVGGKICKPRAQDILLQYIEKTEACNALAFGVDIDGCGSAMMAYHKKPLFRKSIDDLRELISATKLPFIVKGIMCIEDALAAIEAGAQAIVISNHGGRVLDHTPGTADVLPKIATEVKGKIIVLVDGGIRNGYDVLKMLALGADGVLIGRDLIRAAVGAGVKGVRLHMEYLQSTLAKAMLMTDCPTLKDISSDILC
ncbi:MAG: alpha-hydroxy-acid oxidizing protein [Candidatus Hodarchaeota archaeon]